MNASVKLLHRLTAATVGIRARIPAQHPSTVVLGEERNGSGVLLEGSRKILTVNYVVMGAEKLSVTLTDGRRTAARVVAQDFSSGIALLETPEPFAGGLSPRHSTDLQPGCEAVIVASTGREERRVNDGLIMSLGRFDANWEYTLDRALATTAQSPGFGGAPICDLQGRLLGITFLDAGEVGRFTLGIPADHLLDHEGELLEHGRRVSRPPRAWVGCFCYTIRDHVVIAGVLPGAPAAVAGLKAGDVLVAVDAERIRDRQQLYEKLWAQRPGGQMEFRVYRDNGVQSIVVTTGDAEKFFA